MADRKLNFYRQGDKRNPKLAPLVEGADRRGYLGGGSIRRYGPANFLQGRPAQYYDEATMFASLSEKHPEYFEDKKAEIIITPQINQATMADYKGRAGKPPSQKPSAIAARARSSRIRAEAGGNASWKAMNQVEKAQFMMGRARSSGGGIGKLNQYRDDLLKYISTNNIDTKVKGNYKRAQADFTASRDAKLPPDERLIVQKARADGKAARAANRVPPPAKGANGKPLSVSNQSTSQRQITIARAEKRIVAAKRVISKVNRAQGYGGFSGKTASQLMLPPEPIDGAYYRELYG